MAKKEKDRQTIVHMTQQRKLKNKQHEPHQKLRVVTMDDGRQGMRKADLTFWVR